MPVVSRAVVVLLAFGGVLLLSACGAFPLGPRTDPAPMQAGTDEVAEEVLAAVNRARERGYRCAGETYPETHLLQLDSRLNRAAQRHANDLALTGRLSHEGSDGSDPFSRMESVDYQYASAAENVAEGQPDAEAVVRSWLRSRDGHCDNLMANSYRDLGVGTRTVMQNGRTVRYWVVKLGREQ